MNYTMAADIVQPALARSGSSCATSWATTSTSVVRDDNEEDDDDGGGVDAKLPNEMVLSNLIGAPTVTQLTQAMLPHRKHRDRVDISSVNVIEGSRGEHPASRFTPGTGARRKRK